MKNLILAFLLALTSTLVFAQKTNIDSLKSALKAPQTDSARFSLNQNIITFYIEANIDTALLYINQNLAIAQKNGKTLDVASVLDIKGYTLMGLGKLSESLQCFIEGVKIAEDPENETKTWWQDTKLTPQKRRLNVLASLHHDWGHLMGGTNTEQQLFHYHQTKNIAEETSNTTLLGFVNMNIGGVYFDKLQKPDSALVMEHNTERTFIKSGDKRYLGAVYLTIGDIYLAKSNKNLAVQYFHKAIQSGTEQNNINVVSNVYGRLSKFHLKEKQKDSCLIYA
jgi:tetratricopeptide (TPR) repeat protein